jgi:hypothetical protein
LADLFPHTDDEWDRQMKADADAEAGRLDFIDRNVAEAVAKGTTTPLEAGLEENA